MSLRGRVVAAGASCGGGAAAAELLRVRGCAAEGAAPRLGRAPPLLQGAEGGGAGGRGGGGRLEFERQAVEEADPFGLDQFLSDVKGGKSGKGGALDAIGKRGGMSAAGGGASLDPDMAGAGAGMGRRMQFTAEKGR
jgi:SNW domain-containing protein 1